MVASSNSWDDGGWQNIDCSSILISWVDGRWTDLSLFCGANLVVRMAVLSVVVAVIRRSMGVSMSAQDEESDNVREEAQGTNDEDKLRVEDFGRVDKSGNCFEDDGETQCDQEDGIEEGSKDLCPQPLSDVSKAQLSDQTCMNLLQRNTCRCWTSEQP